MQNFKLETGKFGEEIVKKYLKKNGYKIIEQNYKTRFSEIDLIVQKRNEIIFVEVRTKRGCVFGSPEESLDQNKLKKLFFGAKAYTGKIGWSGSIRIDAVCVVLGKNNLVERINHYQNIFSSE